MLLFPASPRSLLLPPTSRACKSNHDHSFHKHTLTLQLVTPATMISTVVRSQGSTLSPAPPTQSASPLNGVTKTTLTLLLPLLLPTAVKIISSVALLNPRRRESSRRLQRLLLMCSSSARRSRISGMSLRLSCWLVTLRAFSGGNTPLSPLVLMRKFFH